MKLGTKEIPALRLGAAAVLKAYLGGSQVWPLGFDPASLFAQGEQGVWYDPSDLSTLFQDSAGTVPVTAVGQPVGLMLDKSGRGNHASQPTATCRPILRQSPILEVEKVDGTIGALGSTYAARCTNIAAGNGFYTVTGDDAQVASVASPDAFLVFGKTYQITLYISAVSGGTVSLFLSNGQNGGLLNPPFMTSNVVGSYAAVVTPDAATRDCITALCGAAGKSVTFRVSVREITGYHSDRNYLEFDGVDDWMVTPTITPGIDKVQVFAGVRKLSDAAFGIMVEHSANFTTNTGSLVLYNGNNVGGAPTYRFISKGTMNGIAAPGDFYASPITNVLTGLGDISGDSAILRTNGTQAAISTGNQGTGNYLAYPLYIGSRGGTALRFNGHLYGLIVRFGSNLPAATIENTEKYINTKTRAY